MNVKDIKSKIRIEEVISRYIKLTKTSYKTYKSICPFHNEHKPSFTVYTDSQRYFCFGCERCGDVITFIMEIEKVDFKKALKILKKYI